MTNPEITPERLATTVERMADFLSEKGWCHGALNKYDWNTQSYSYCTLGALQEVESDWVNRVYVEQALACALEKVTGQPEIAGSKTFPRIAKWNDRHRNGKNVISKLRAAAATIRTGECSQ